MLGGVIVKTMFTPVICLSLSVLCLNFKTQYTKDLSLQRMLEHCSKSVALSYLNLKKYMKIIVT